jgi:hypothetical protein
MAPDADLRREIESASCSTLIAPFNSPMIALRDDFKM